ncbi:MAG: hypothetical protein HGA87_02685, partial [Desulfobulbaceae bacterium]|nr:hypothetical protein [Desulfobulbaceae bacterium]
MGKPIPDNIKGLIYKLEPGCKEQQIALKNLSVFLSKEGLTLRDVIAFRDDLDMHKEDAAKAKIYVKEIERAFEENDQALKEAKQQFEEAKNKAFKVIEDRDKIIKDREQQVADLEKRLTTASQEKQTLAGQKTQLEREIKNLKSSGSNAVGRKALLITFAMAASFVVGGILFSEKVPKKTIAQETQQEPSAQQDPFTKPTDSKRIFHNINYYISRDNVSLWATIIRGKGVQQISTLSIGERVFVQLPNERHRIHPQNKWVHISLLNGQEGYVLSKNL